MAETLMKKGILVLTGADCSGPAVEIAKVGAKYEIPVISNGANASMLSSAEEFPYFVRVVTPSEQYEGYLIDMAVHFGVEEIALFYTTDAWGLGAKNVINQYAKRRAIKIAQEYGYPQDTPYDEVKAYMEKVKKTVDLVSVGSVDPATGRLTVNEGAIVWPGNVTTPPKQ
jgi:ABC-type branched-subunit amino acid transport system substrate-binding protein